MIFSQRRSSRKILNTTKAEAYTELLNPRHAALLKKSAALGKEFMRGVTANFEFKNVTETELALEIAVS